MKALQKITSFLNLYGSPLLFLGAYFWVGPLFAVKVLMVSATVIFCLSWAVQGKFPRFQVFMLFFLFLFGGISLYFSDPVFIQLKLTLVESLLGSLFLYSAFFGPDLFGWFYPDLKKYWTAEQNRAAAWRLSLLFYLIAALNEGVRRLFDFSLWVWYKSLGVPLVTFIYMLAHYPFLRSLLEPFGKDAPPKA